jgi:CHRD domain/Abnormal spindle-like microcephaly-assoc'd, ASPM-SPD-2-Hydin
MRTRIWIIVAAAAVAAVLLGAGTGRAGGPPSLSWSPSTSGAFDFGSVAVGHDASQEFTLTNSGGSASAALTVTLTGPAAFSIAADNCTGTSLGPRKSCTVTVTYAPTEAGQTDPATLAAQGKKDAATASLTLTGRGVLQFSADLNSANENPPHPESHGRGTIVVTWDTVTSTMSVDIAFSDLTTPNIAAHIHCCIAPPGNTGVATPVPTYPAFPTGTTSGTYQHTFDMTQTSSYNPAFVSSHGGTAASAAAALLAGLQAGQAYQNIHTQMFPGGEIRGFLQPS